MGGWQHCPLVVGVLGHQGKGDYGIKGVWGGLIRVKWVVGSRVYGSGGLGGRRV